MSDLNRNGKRNENHIKQTKDKWKISKIKDIKRFPLPYFPGLLGRQSEIWEYDDLNYHLPS